MDNKTMIKVINGMADKIESLEDKIKHNAENIDTIHDNTNSNLEEISDNGFKITELENKIKSVEQEIPDVNQSTDYTDALNVKYDDLEAKNYQLKADFDKIAHCITDDINDLEVRQSEEQELYAENNNNIDINKIVDEILYKVAPEHIKNNVKEIFNKHINNKMEGK